MMKLSDIDEEIKKLYQPPNVDLGPPTPSPELMKLKKKDLVHIIQHNRMHIGQLNNALFNRHASQRLWVRRLRLVFAQNMVFRARIGDHMNFRYSLTNHRLKKLSEKLKE